MNTVTLFSFFHQSVRLINNIYQFSIDIYMETFPCNCFSSSNTNKCFVLKFVDGDDKRPKRIFVLNIVTYAQKTFTFSDQVS